jgi:translation initiation factor 4A
MTEFNNTDKNDENDKVEVYETFDSMNLDDNILRGIYSYGFEYPSEVQKKGIVAVINGQDTIVQAQSGTGKTATFSISLLSKITKEEKIQGVIISPTRELATQSFKVIQSIGHYTDFCICLCIGGESVLSNVETIQNKNPQIIVATPGRILDLIDKRGLSTADIKTLIVDEADEMLSRGFKDQMYQILQKMPESLNISLFSATIPNEMFDVTNRFMRNPLKILVKNENLTLEGIKQYFIKLQRPEYKLDVLIDLYQYISVSQTIIYCNDKRRVDFVTRKLTSSGFTVSSIHGNMNSKDRIDIMNSFRNGETRILISTDLLARGIDIQQISLVINYEIPLSKENYIHRIGRSGRFGRKGVAINLISRYEINRLREIEEFYSTQIEPLPADVAEIIS